MTTPVEVKATPGAAPSKELEQVFMDHYDMVYRTAYRVTGNGDDAEDVLQTLFVRLLRRETMPQLERGWPAYLHRASVNISLDIIRRRGVMFRSPTWSRGSGTNDPGRPASTTVPSWGTG